MSEKSMSSLANHPKVVRVLERLQEFSGQPPGYLRLTRISPLGEKSLGQIRDLNVVDIPAKIEAALEDGAGADPVDIQYMAPSGVKVHFTVQLPPSPAAMQQQFAQNLKMAELQGRDAMGIGALDLIGRLVFALMGNAENVYRRGKDSEDHLLTMKKEVMETQLLAEWGQLGNNEIDPTTERMKLAKEAVVEAFGKPAGALVDYFMKQDATAQKLLPKSNGTTPAAAPQPAPAPAAEPAPAASSPARQVSKGEFADMTLDGFVAIIAEAPELLMDPARLAKLQPYLDELEAALKLARAMPSPAVKPQTSQGDQAPPHLVLVNPLDGEPGDVSDDDPFTEPERPK